MKHLEQLMVTVGLVDKVTKPIQGINDQLRKTGQTAQQSWQHIAGGAAGLLASGAALYTALQPAIEMDDALAEVKSLGVVQDDLDLLRKTARHFSVEFGESATDFVKSAYDIKSAMGDMTGKELAGITEASAVLAKGTKSDAETVTKYMGSMYSIFKNQAEAMGKDNFAAMIAGQTAQAVEAFKTSGTEMSAAFSSLGSSAAAMGVNVTEQLAVLGTLQGSMGGARAGTQYTAFIDGAISAQKKLGMSFQDSRGKLLPMVQILGKLKDKVGDMGEADQYKVLKDAFGSTQAVKLIQNLMPDIDGLAASINNVGQQTGMDKATQMAQDMTSQFDRLTKAFWAVREGAGNSILPTVIDMTAAMADNVALVAEWTEMFPHLTGAVTSVVVSFAAFVAIGSALKILMGVSTFVISGYRMALLGLVWVMKLLRVGFILSRTLTLAWAAVQMTGTAATLLFASAQMALGAAMAFVFSPFFLIIAALALLAVGAVWLARNWDALKASFMESEAFSKITVFLDSAKQSWQSFMNMLSNLSPIDMLGSAIDWLIDKLNMIPGINIKTSGAMPEAAKVTQEVSRSYSGAPIEQSNLAGVLSPEQVSINQSAQKNAVMPKPLGMMSPVTQQVAAVHDTPKLPPVTQQVAAVHDTPKLPPVTQQVASVHDTPKLPPVTQQVAAVHDTPKLPPVTQQVAAVYDTPKLPPVTQQVAAVYDTPKLPSVTQQVATVPNTPKLPPVVQEVASSYIDEQKNSNVAASLPRRQDNINELLSAVKTPTSIKEPPAPLMPQMAKMTNQNAGKTVHFGDVHIKNEQGMDPAAMAEWEELQHGF